jgi:tetratricopeptide (TPR) repeat protein
MYALRASFEERSPGQWQGKIISNPVTVTVVDTPATPTVEERKAPDLLRVEYFLGLKDYDHAIAAAQDVLSLDPRSIDGSFMLGTVQESKGDLQSALGAYETALTKFHDRYPGDDPPEAALQAVRRVRDKLGIKLAPIVESQ